MKYFSFGMMNVLFAALLTFSGCGDGSAKGVVNPMVPSATVKTPSVSESVTNADQTLIVNSAGVKIDVPQGAVPLSDTGASEPVVFSIEEVTQNDSNVTMPLGYEKVGKSWLIGPENFIFSKNIKLTFPIDETLKSDTIYQLARLNQETNQWEFIPSEITQDLTTQTVSVQKQDKAIRTTTRQDPGNAAGMEANVRRGGTYAIFSSPHRSTEPGVIKIVNYFMDRYISIDIFSYELAYPQQDSNWNPRTAVCNLPLAPLNHPDLTNKTNLVLPQGKYILAITRHSPPSLDTPSGLPDGWIKTEVLTVDQPGQIPANESITQSIEYRPSAILNISSNTFDSGLITNPIAHTCADLIPSKIYGQGGDVGVTLTWGKKVDLDLYVTDPSGETIYYAHDSSESGGKLDVDRKCSNIDGGPLMENIFWPSGKAPTGAYTVKVNFFENCSNLPTPISFNVKTVINGNPTTFSKTIANEQDDVAVTTFQFNGSGTTHVIDPALVGDWTIEGVQKNVARSEWTGTMSLNNNGTIKMVLVQGLQTDTRSGTWYVENNVLYIEYTDPAGHPVKWKGPFNGTKTKISNGIYQTPTYGPGEYGWGGYWHGSKN